jgi:hypothetical protein
MRGKPSILAVVLAALAAVSYSLMSPALGWTAAAESFAASDCDRQCLYGFVDQYMAALVAKDPARLPWAAHAKFTENNVELPIGYGLWGTISGRGADDACRRSASGTGRLFRRD